MRLIVNDGLAVVDLGGEKVVLNVESGQYYRLNDAGAAILDLLWESRRISEVIELLADKYACGPERLRTEVEVFVETLRENGMVRVDDPEL
jgi:hypothetical protein